MIFNMGGGKNTKDANITPYDVTKGKIAYGSKDRVVGVSPFQFSEDVKVRTIPSYVRAIAEGTVSGKSVMVGVVHLPEGLMAGTYNVYVSYDKGVTWKSIANSINVGSSGPSQGLGTSKWNDICWDPVGKMFLTVGDKGAVAWSSDGIKWTEDAYTQEVTGGAGDTTNCSCCPDRRGGALWCNGNGTIFHIYKNYTLVESFGHIPAVQFIGISAQAIKRTNGSTTVNTYALCAAGMSVDSSTNQAHKYVYVYSPKVNQSTSSGDVSVMSVSSGTLVVDEYENIIETQEYVMEPRLISVANYGGLENQVLEDEQLELVSFTVSYEDGLWDANLDDSALVSSELTTKVVKDSCSGKILYGLDDTLVTYRQGVGGTISFPDFDSLVLGSDVVISNHLVFSGVDDTLYILDLGNKRIFNVNFDTGEVSTSVIWGCEGDLVDTTQVESEFGIKMNYRGSLQTMIGKSKAISLPLAVTWRDIAFGNGKFVAVPSSGNIAVVSTDGINWSEVTLPRSGDWGVICYGDGKFVTALKGSSTIAYSTDGENWTVKQITTSAQWQDIVYGNGYFILTAPYATGISTDGITWSSFVRIGFGITKLAVNESAGNFCAICSGTSVGYVSSDAKTWTQTTLPKSASWQSIACGNGRYVAIVLNSTSAAYSDDGINWTATSLPAACGWRDITYGNGKFIAVATDTTYVAVSSDGITWELGNLNYSGQWYAVTYGDDKFVTVGGRYGEYSLDGIEWVNQKDFALSFDNVYSIIEVSLASEMDALLTEENKGKTYRYTGATTTKYINGDLYVVEEV